MYLWVVKRVWNYGLVSSRADAVQMCDAACMAFIKALLFKYFLHEPV